MLEYAPPEAPVSPPRYHPGMLAIRCNFAERAVVPPERFEWVASPGGEVERVMLDRLGGEVAVATSLVRYSPAARFPAHEHGRGEEFLVLEGEFADQYGRYPAGTYVRNPPGSRHAPFSEPGCVIWVKLRQFHPEDELRVVCTLDESPATDAVAYQRLHQFRDEVVTAVSAPPGQAIDLPAKDVVQEVLVVEGSVRYAGQPLGRWGWLRVPAGEGARIEVERPCRLLHKTRPEFALIERDV